MMNNYRFSDIQDTVWRAQLYPRQEQIKMLQEAIRKAGDLVWVLIQEEATFRRQTNG